MLDRNRKPAEIGSADQVFRDLLLGTMKAAPELERYLNDSYGIGGESPFTLILCCPEGHSEDSVRECRRALGQILSLFSGCSHVTIDFPYRKILATVAYGYAGPGSVASILQSRLADLGPDAVVGCAETVGVFSLHDTYESLFPYMDWNIALGSGSVIRFPEVAQIKTESCIYPIELENRMRSAMYASNYGDTSAALRQFNAFFHLRAKGLPAARGQGMLCPLSVAHRLLREGDRGGSEPIHRSAEAALRNHGGKDAAAAG